MKTKKNESIILKKDQPEIEAVLADVEELKTALQGAVDEFKETPFYDPEASLPVLINEAERLRNDFKAEKVKAMYTIPKDSVLELDFTELGKAYRLPTPGYDQKRAEVKQLLSVGGVDLTFFYLKDGRVLINEARVQMATDRFVTKAETPDEIEFVKRLQSVIRAEEALNGFLAKHRFQYPYSSQNRPIVSERWFSFDGERKSVGVPMYERFRMHLKRRGPQEDD